MYQGAVLTCHCLIQQARHQWAPPPPAARPPPARAQESRTAPLQRPSPAVPAVALLVAGLDDGQVKAIVVVGVGAAVVVVVVMVVVLAVVVLVLADIVVVLL